MEQPIKKINHKLSIQNPKTKNPKIKTSQSMEQPIKKKEKCTEID